MSREEPERALVALAVHDLADEMFTAQCDGRPVDEAELETIVRRIESSAAASRSTPPKPLPDRRSTHERDRDRLVEAWSSALATYDAAPGGAAADAAFAAVVAAYDAVQAHERQARSGTRGSAPAGVVKGREEMKA